MRALISKLESRETGFRVAQVVEDTATFPVSDSLMWVECPPDLVADSKWFNETTGEFCDFPIVEVPIIESKVP